MHLNTFKVLGTDKMKVIVLNSHTTPLNYQNIRDPGTYTTLLASLAQVFCFFASGFDSSDWSVKDLLEKVGKAT